MSYEGVDEGGVDGIIRVRVSGKGRISRSLCLEASLSDFLSRSLTPSLSHCVSLFDFVSHSRA